jgi:hypothetical protein
MGCYSSASTFESKPLPFSNEGHKKYRLFHAMWQPYFRQDDDYDMHDFNPNWRIKPSIILTDSGPRVLTCRHHDGGDDHLRLYPPRPPNHNLCAERSDQLSHITSNPRVVKATAMKKFGSTYSLVRQQGGYAGIDTMTISTSGDHSFSSQLLAEHEALSCHRDDIVHLMSQKVEKNQMSQELADNIVEESNRLFPPGSIQRYIDGTTYIPFIKNVRLYLAQSREIGDDGEIEAVKRNGDTVRTKRVWPREINIVQMEDSSGYGYQFRATPAFSDREKLRPTMMAWVMSSLLTSVDELWRAVDEKQGPYHFDGWEANFLPFLQQQVFNFDSVTVTGSSPFRRVQNQKEAVDAINRFAPIEYQADNPENDSLGKESIFMFSIRFFRQLFPHQQYPTISIQNSIEDVLSSNDSFEEKNVILIVDWGKPEVLGSENERESIVLNDGSVFELRSICLISGEEQSMYADQLRPNNYKATRYIRYGGGFNSWWKEERFDHMVTQCPGDVVGMEILGNENDEEGFFDRHVSAYVRVQTPDVDQWRLKIFRSLGGN